MKKTFEALLQSINRHSRWFITIIVCLLTTTFITPEASASVDFVNQWPATPTIVSNGTTIPVSGKFTVGAGTNRLMLVTVATEYSAAQAPTFTVTYGGQTVTMLQNYTTGNNKIWLGYLKESFIAAATSKILTVTPSTYANLTALYANCAVFNGVDQTAATFSGSASGGTTVAALTTTPAVAYVNAGNNGLTGNTGMSVYVVNWNNITVGQTTASTGYTENRNDYIGTNFSLVANYKVTTANTSESLISTTTASAIAGLAGVSLNPVINTGANYATIFSCGDCHGNPPVDGARNVIAGAFLGSHEKHGGGTNVQYSYACTTCHYNQTLYKHSDGFKNITGSSLPGNAYTAPGGKKIAISNSPSTTGTCTNTYCHSTGRTNKQYTAPTWGGATTNCLSCHAGRAGTGNGVQANSSLGFKLSSSHSQHLKPPYTAANVNCQMCHGSVASFDGTNLTLKNYSGTIYHADGTNNVVFRDLAYGTYTAYKTGSKTCSNISCHGGKSRGGWQNASINTTNACTHCHGQPTAANILPSNTNRNNFAPGYLNTGTSTDQIAVNTDFRVGGHFVHLSSVYTKKLKCNECHRVPATAFDGTHMTGPRYSSQSLTFAQASTATKNGVTPAFISGAAATAAICSTTFCHGSSMPKGDTGGTDKSPLWNAAALMTGTPGADCAKCHGNPPLFGSSSSAHVGSAATISCYGCHKTVTNASGAIINKALHLDGLVSTSVNTAATTTCHSCHGNPPQALTYGRYSGLVKPKTLALGPSPANVGAHKKHQDKGLTCNACHNNYAAVLHPDSKIQIFFRITSATITGWNATSPKAPFGTYSGNIPTGGTPVDTVSSTLVRGTADNTNNSCNTYCHGNWNGSNKNMNPRWATNIAAATTCGACHGATPLTPPLVGTHARHAGYSSALTARQGYSIGCIKCHPSRSTSDHIKGTVHVRYSTAVLGTNATYTKTGATLTTPAGSRLYGTNKLAGDTPDGTCSNISCHSNARATGMGTTQYATTATWGNTTRNCLACHGGRNGATGAPARSTAGFTLSTTHSQHLKYPAANINCQTCHSKVVTDAVTLKSYTGVKRHANGGRNVTFTGVIYGTYTAYKSTETGSAGTAKTCNNVSCHGGKSRSAWSSSAQNNDNTCLHCHGSGNSTGIALRADRYNSAPGWVAPAGTGISTDGFTVNTDKRVGGHFVHLSSVYMKKLKCNECHAVPTGPFDGTHMATARYNSQTLTFFQASTATKNSVVPAFVAGTSGGAANCTTTFCHGSSMPKGDTSGTDKSPLWDAAALMTGTPGADCSKCHGNPPTTGTSAGAHSLQAATISCGGCHDMVVNGSGNIINKALHMNGIVESVTACNGCHDYDTNGGTWGLVKNKNYGGTAGVEGRGAHYKHIEYLKTRGGVITTLDASIDQYSNTAPFNVICGVCHNTDGATYHTTGNPAGSRAITFPVSKQFGASVPLFNGLYNTSSNVNPKSCSNLDCHYRTSPIWSTY